MSQQISFADLMLALRNAVLSATIRLNEKSQKLLGAYFETDGQTPNSISITGAAVGEIKAPLFAITPLTTLGINLASFKMTLPVFTRNGRLWVSLGKGVGQTVGETQLKEIQTSLCINPHEHLEQFLETVNGLERGFLSEIS